MPPAYLLPLQYRSGDQRSTNRESARVLFLLGRIGFSAIGIGAWRIHSGSMTNQEKKRLSVVLRATEYLFLENITLKLVLKHREVPNWQELLEHLLADKEILAGIRLKFRDIYDEIEGAAEPSEVLEVFLGELPVPKKPQ